MKLLSAAECGRTRQASGNVQCQWEYKRGVIHFQSLLPSYSNTTALVGKLGDELNRLMAQFANKLGSSVDSVKTEGSAEIKPNGKSLIIYGIVSYRGAPDVNSEAVNDAVKETAKHLRLRIKPVVWSV